MASIIAARNAEQGVKLSYRLEASRGVVTFLVASVVASTMLCAHAQAPSQTTPAQSPSTPMPPSHPSAETKKSPAKAIKKVDLNNASLAELKTLPTVGDAEAKKIVAGRPYISKTDLVTKGGLPEGVYLAVRDHVIVNTQRKPAPKK
jgi:DNA uptake protein ComE-like DNA-binding protein